MATDRIDLGREYVGGFAVPNALQAGNGAQVSADGTDLVYPPDVQEAPTTPTAWDQESRAIMVRGSGARSVTLPNADKVGRQLWVIDAERNAGSGTITIDPDGAGTIDTAADLVLSTNGARALLIAEAVGATTDWLRLV